MGILSNLWIWGITGRQFFRFVLGMWAANIWQILIYRLLWILLQGLCFVFFHLKVFSKLSNHINPAAITHLALHPYTLPPPSPSHKKALYYSMNLFLIGRLKKQNLHYDVVYYSPSLSVCRAGLSLYLAKTHCTRPAGQFVLLCIGCVVDSITWLGLVFLCCWPNLSIKHRHTHSQNLAHTPICWGTVDAGGPQASAPTWSRSHVAAHWAEKGGREKMVVVVERRRH